MSSRFMGAFFVAEERGRRQDDGVVAGVHVASVGALGPMETTPVASSGLSRSRRAANFGLEFLVRTLRESLQRRPFPGR